MPLTYLLPDTIYLVHDFNAYTTVRFPCAARLVHGRVLNDVSNTLVVDADRFTPFVASHLMC